MKPELTIQRYSDNLNDTLGILFKQENLFCYTLEDPYRSEKIKHKTRIPSGVYQLAIQKLVTPMTAKYRKKFTWFEYHIMLLNVPGFDSIYIHIGNDAEDTSGCILIADIANNNSFQNGFISNSTNAYKRFYMAYFQRLMNGEQIFINIRDEKELFN